MGQGEDEFHRLRQLAGDGNPRAMYNLGLRIQRSDPLEARMWFERGSQLGNGECMYALGSLVARRHPFKAQRLFEAAARNGVPQAMVKVATFRTLASYLPVRRKKKREESMRWLERAAEYDNVEAMWLLGVYLYDHDDHASRKWLQRAAARGHRSAQVVLEQGVTARSFSRMLRLDRQADGQ